MANADSEQSKKALELVLAGLQSGSIKLMGTHTIATGKSAATADALYLTELLAALSSSIAKLE